MAVTKKRGLSRAFLIFEQRRRISGVSAELHPGSRFWVINDHAAPWIDLNGHNAIHLRTLADLYRESMKNNDFAALSVLVGVTRPELMRNETLVDIFTASATRYPNQLALQFQTEPLTYSALAAWSNQFAATLHAAGIQRGDAVVVYQPRGLMLQVAILAILRVGAAYVPVDRETPPARVTQIAHESEASAIVTDANLNLPIRQIAVSAYDPDSATPDIADAMPDDTAYIIYTSGSTGKPKGIPITHRMICHLARAEQEILQLEAADRVYQGFSVAFDMWCEEVWVSYLVGASQIIADSLTAKAVDELPDFWRQQGVTVLHAVPSVLALLDGRTLPNLRVINSGGEACTPTVVDRWAAPGRRLLNSYGPSEITVTATMAELKPGQPIELGQPLPNYGLAVVDTQLNPVPQGVLGELVISGAGVSHGYLRRPELTAEKFLPKPDTLSMLPGARIYRTGDSALITPDGALQFAGRLDDQVKLRGYRIELGEIENILARLPQIRTAVALVTGEAGAEQLIAALELAPGETLTPDLYREHCRQLLPTYMVPGDFIQLDRLHRLVSGKIDRAAIRQSYQPPQASEAVSEDYASDDSVAKRLLTALAAVFPGQKIDLTQDFFDDLGGHSLRAASLVSRLRTHGYLPQAALRDVYLHRPLNQLVAHWEQTVKKHAGPIEHFLPVKPWLFYGCALAQTLVLPVLFGLFSLQIFLPYLAYYYVQDEYDSHTLGILAAIINFLVIPPCFVVLGIIGKKLIGRFEPGDYPLWGLTYFRYWLCSRLLELSPIQYFNDTPFYIWYVRLLGMQVAPAAHLGRITFGIPELITIGRGATLSSEVVLDNAVIEKGRLKIRRIEIGDYAYVGSSAVVAGGASIGFHAELADLSYLLPDQQIPTGEIWRGSPARPWRQKTPAEMPCPAEPSARRQAAYKLLFAGFLLLFPLLLLLPIVPTVVLLNEMDMAAPDYDFSYLIVTPALATLYVALFMVITIVMTRVLMRKMPVGDYPLYSMGYFRKWVVDQVNSLALFVLHPLYASIFINAYYRALGAKVGHNAEISTASNVTHHLLEIGSNGFIADAVVLGESDVRHQRFILKPTRIGANTFIGNGAVVPQGSLVPDNMLLGVLSLAPENNEYQAGIATYLGVPALPFPRRELGENFNAALTLHPNRRRRLARGVVEFLRIILPTTVIICCSVLFIAYGHDLLTDDSPLKFCLLLPFYYLSLVGLPTFGVVLLLKWLLIGRYRPRQIPMWTLSVWLAELVTTSYEALPVPFVLNLLKGTPWLAVCLRLLGVKIGRRCVLDSTDFTEFDCVTVGDDTALNTHCGPQTHLFEDRIMKIGRVQIGSRCSIGSCSVVLYDTQLGDDVQVAPLSLVMKGERLPNASHWHGSPVQPV